MDKRASRRTVCLAGVEKARQGGRVKEEKESSNSSDSKKKQGAERENGKQTGKPERSRAEQRVDRYSFGNQSQWRPVERTLEME